MRVNGNRNNGRRLSFALAIGLAAVALAGAATAFAAITVYSNSFKSQASFDEIRRTEGGASLCRALLRNGRMQVTVVKDATRCIYSPPVQGDAEIPNHDFQVATKVFKGDLPPAVLKAAYVSIGVRVSKDDGYELRIFPRTGRYRLLRFPGGTGFPAKGESGDINRIAERNVLRLRAIGAKVTAFVNGKKLVDVDDPNPGQVEGMKLSFGVSSNKDLNKGPTAAFDKAVLKIPEP